MKTFGVVAVVVSLLLGGCAVAPPPRMAGDQGSALGVDYGVENSQTSLFAGDATLLSDADIDRILRYPYAAPQQSRVAVLALGQERSYGYSDELARSGEEIRSSVIAELNKASTVTDVSFLPSLLVPQTRSVAHLREAATRYQANILVVYQASCRTYDKYRMFSASSSKSFCNIEAVVLDVRTGIVPFSTTVTQEFVTTQSSADTNFYETMIKAEAGAIRTGLVKVASRIAGFLG